MAQLVEHTVQFDQLESLRSHGSVGRAHRSHRWGHRFESCCDHHNLSENVKFSDIFYIISVFFAAI